MLPNLTVNYLINHLDTVEREYLYLIFLYYRVSNYRYNCQHVD